MKYFRRFMMIIILMGMITLTGCSENRSNEIATSEVSEEIQEPDPTEGNQVKTEEGTEPSSTEAVIDENFFNEQEDIILADIKMSSLSEIEIKTIDLNSWNIQGEDVDIIRIVQDGAKIVLLLNRDSESAQIVILEEGTNGVWSQAYSEEFPGLFRIEMSPSGKMLALVYRYEQKVAIFDLDQKEILAETEVFARRAIVSWSSDEQRLISFVFYGSLDLFAEVAEIFSVPYLERIKVIEKSNPENQRWQPWGFWWSPDNEIDKFIIKTRKPLLYWEGEEYKVLDQVDVEFENTPISVSWINENEYIVTDPNFHEDCNIPEMKCTEHIFYLFDGPRLLDEYRIIEQSETFSYVVGTRINPEKTQISAIFSSGYIVFLQIRDEAIRSLCQVDINSFPDLGSARLISSISNDSLFYLSEDNLLHIISNITCD